MWIDGELQDIHPLIGDFSTTETENGFRECNDEVILSIVTEENEEGNSPVSYKMRLL